MPKRLITLVASPKDKAKWGCGSRPDDTVIAVPNVGVLRSMIAERSASDGFWIERIVLDRSVSSAEFLVFLTELPDEIQGDVLYVESENRTFLSAAGPEGRRVLYLLTDVDLNFYCAVNALCTAGATNIVSECEGAGQASRVKVLIAEDEGKTRSLLTGLVEQLGCEALVARTGLEALRAAMQHHPDVIFLDGLMPEMHGLEVARVIRQTDPAYTPRIVMLTAFDATRYRNDAKLRYGVDGFLAKPVSRDDLASAIFDEDGGWRLGRRGSLAVAATS